MSAQNDLSFETYNRRHRVARTIRKVLSNLLLGLCIIGVGVGYLGNELDALPWDHFTLFFPGWWGAVFFILPALYFTIRSRFSWFATALFLIGFCVVVTKNEVMPFHKAMIITLCALVILIGLRIIFNPLFKRAKLANYEHKMKKFQEKVAGKTEANTQNADKEFRRARFCERTDDFSGQVFSSGSFSCSFGELTVDLTHALVLDCAVIEASCSFGQLNIKLPDNAVAEVISSASFAEVKNRRKSTPTADPVTVYINAECSFGEISIQ